MQKQCTFPQVDVLKQKCRRSYHVTCMLPWELIWQEVALPHKKGMNTERPYTSEGIQCSSLFHFGICAEVLYKLGSYLELEPIPVDTVFFKEFMLVTPEAIAIKQKRLYSPCSDGKHIICRIHSSCFIRYQGSAWTVMRRGVSCT